MSIELSVCKQARIVYKERWAKWIDFLWGEGGGGMVNPVPNSQGKTSAICWKSLEQARRNERQKPVRDKLRETGMHRWCRLDESNLQQIRRTETLCNNPVQCANGLPKRAGHAVTIIIVRPALTAVCPIYDSSAAVAGKKRTSCTVYSK